MEKEVLISFPLYSVTGHMGMAQRYTKGGFDWTLENIYLPGAWSNTGNRLPREEVNVLCLSGFNSHLDKAVKDML